MPKIYLFFLIISILLVSCKSSPVLKETVLSLKEIKEIGELVTAEYYGEVISGHSVLVNNDFQSVFFNSIDIVRFELEKKRKDIDIEYNTKIEGIKAKIKKLENKNIALFKNARIKELNDEKRSLDREKKRKKNNSANKIRSDNFKSSINLLKVITKKSKKEIISLIDKNTDSILYKKYKQALFDYARQDKKELVYIGRGSVKAGYNLKSIDSLNIFFSDNRDTMYLLDFDPFITDLDINPYFYFPSDSTQDSLELYGFEIIYQKKSKNFTLKEVNDIKSDCKLKLRQEALQRKIYDHAHQNAEEALSAFFGLLKTDKGNQVEKVIISHSKYFYYKSNYLYDLMIDSNEYKVVEEIIKEDLDSLDIVSFKYQTHEYQLMHLDKFIKALYENTKYSDNYEKWDSLYIAYITDRKIRN